MAVASCRWDIALPSWTHWPKSITWAYCTTIREPDHLLEFRKLFDILFLFGCKIKVFCQIITVVWFSLRWLRGRGKCWGSLTKFRMKLIFKPLKSFFQRHASRSVHWRCGCPWNHHTNPTLSPPLSHLAKALTLFLRGRWGISEISMFP